MRRTIQTRTQYRIVGSDYSAQEPRMTCYLSQDKNMLEAYLEKKDLYAMIAASALNNEYGDNLEFYPEGTELNIDGKKVICGYKTHKNMQGKANRGIGKGLLLAATYGMGAATAGAQMKKTAKEGRQLLDNFFKGFPGVKKAIEDSQASLREKGYVEDFVGRRRRLTDFTLPPYTARYRDEEKQMSLTFNPILGCSDRPANDPLLNEYLTRAKTARREEFDALVQEALSKGIILRSNTGRIAQAERQCFNARIQGSAASLTKIAMLDIARDEELKSYDTHLIIPVHDELLVECKAYYADRVEKRLPEVMINAAKEVGDNVPQACDPYNVKRWYADEMATELRDLFVLYTKGDTKKNVEPVSRDEALKKIQEEFDEFSLEEIAACIDSDGELIC